MSFQRNAFCKRHLAAWTWLMVACSIPISQAYTQGVSDIGSSPVPPPTTQCLKWLGHERWLVRQHAREHLRQRLLDPQHSDATLRTLQQFLNPPPIDFEVAATIRDLVETELERRNRWHGEDLRRWLSPSPSSEAHSPGAEALIDAMRQRYARSLLAWSQGNARGTDLQAHLNPLQIPADDCAAWAMLLYVDVRIAKANRNRLDVSVIGSFGERSTFGDRPSLLRMADRPARIAMVLAGPSMGPDLAGVPEADGLRDPIERLVEQWFVEVGQTRFPREAILAGLRFRRHAFALERCERVLRASNSSPAAVAVALLGMSKLAPERLDALYTRFEQDRRLAHVWQNIHSGPQIIRTRIDDVAIAAKLQRAALDPRDFGFIYLRADAATTYLPYSLGFIDESSRARAHAAAAAIGRLPKN
ncbi:MAG: hypothetical protein AAF958_07695 [Planctomycetota bacterium]